MNKQSRKKPIPEKVEHKVNKVVDNISQAILSGSSPSEYLYFYLYIQ